MTDSDVVVVGAGLAGLRTADLLAQAGQRVVVVEARDRVGGRTWTTNLADAPVELGAQWVGPSQHRMLALLQSLGLATHDVSHKGRKVVAMGNKVRTHKGTIPPLSPTALGGLQAALWSLDRLARGIDVNAPWNSARAQELDGKTLEQFKRSHIPSAAGRAVFDVAIRVVFGAEASEVSLLWAAHYAAGAGGMMPLLEIRDGAQEQRISAGTQSVANALAARLGDVIMTEHAVDRITQDADGVTVSGAWGDLRAQRVVLALPPHLCARIDFSPQLPAARDALTQRFPMGQTIKVQARYAEAFWRKAGLSGEAVCVDGPLSVVIDGSGPGEENPGLSAFMVGAPGREAATWTVERRKKEALTALARCFGPQAAEPLDYIDLDWSAETWTRGCPTASAAPGALYQFGDTLRTPVGRIHWAGTETARQWVGYMEGALESAERVVGELTRS